MNIAIIEDDKYFGAQLSKEFGRWGEVYRANNFCAATELLKRGPLQLAIIDLNLDPGKYLDGLKLVELAKELSIPAVVLSSHHEAEIVTQAYQLGCEHFFTKANFQLDISENVRRITSQISLDQVDDFFAKNFITLNKNLKDNYRFALKQAHNSKNNIFITGPTGCGKTLLAKNIHQSVHPTAPFVHLSLAEIPEHLLESELFGHTKGAFTGAIENKKGLLELANGGTLFLDEIGAASLAIQKKLLRVLEEKNFSPLGSTIIVHSNFRLISATCDDLEKLLNDGLFRIDFYFRLRGVEIKIPPLKERREDILAQLVHFQLQEARKFALNSECLDILQQYDWFGNTRELRSFVRQLSQSDLGIVRAEDLPLHIRKNTNPAQQANGLGTTFLAPWQRALVREQGLQFVIGKIERESVQFALEHAEGRVNEVARNLKLSKTLLYRIIKDIEQESNAHAGT